MRSIFFLLLISLAACTPPDAGPVPVKGLAEIDEASAIRPLPGPAGTRATAADKRITCSEVLRIADLARWLRHQNITRTDAINRLNRFIDAQPGLNLETRSALHEIAPGIASQAWSVKPVVSGPVYSELIRSSYCS